MEPTAKSKCKPVMRTPMKSTESQTTDNSNLTQDGSLFYWKEHKTILISYWCFLVPQKVFYHLGDFFIIEVSSVMNHWAARSWKCLMNGMWMELVTDTKIRRLKKKLKQKNSKATQGFQFILFSLLFCFISFGDDLIYVDWSADIFWDRKLMKVFIFQHGFRSDHWHGSKSNEAKNWFDTVSQSNW